MIFVKLNISDSQLESHGYLQGVTLNTEFTAFFIDVILIKLPEIINLRMARVPWTQRGWKTLLYIEWKFERYLHFLNSGQILPNSESWISREIFWL